ncbi:PH domain-like protein [Sporormia fimetaria CBS 119925]|uniref:PH domain-like protein n=1 Tax=Sporormia fimetaria CBS 119925 TaxID=1340428 RepID=A0A6A6V1M3_9PLEO|nr:PH domain-like protein [Sporormia fimetaria CBS 119925]
MDSTEMGNGPYETDDTQTQLPGAATAGPAIPGCTTDKLTELNNKVLRRHYPEVRTIRHITKFAKLYVMKEGSEVWDTAPDGGVEGSLFVCELEPLPTCTERFALVILNRRGLNNFHWEITCSEDDIAVEGNVINIRAESVQKIFGLWIWEHNKEAVHNAAEELLDCAYRAEQSRRKCEHAEKSEALRANIRMAPHPTPGRQITLSELFGMEREQDSGWSVHDHHSGVMYSAQGAPGPSMNGMIPLPRAQGNYPAPGLPGPSRNGMNPLPRAQGNCPAPGPPGPPTNGHDPLPRAQGNLLDHLFMKARQEPNPHS